MQIQNIIIAKISASLLQKKRKLYTVLKNKGLGYTLLAISILLILIAAIDFYNQYEVYPNADERKAILSMFPRANNIRTKEEIILIQNQVIDSIPHAEASMYPLNIIEDLKKRKGLCYNRSLLLQKILLMNGFQVRPIYLYFSGNKETQLLEIFNSKVESHSIFEVKIGESWYVIRTNSRIKEFENISEYLNSTRSAVPKHTRYIRYLSNRNCRFISPGWLPDIYGVFNFSGLIRSLIFGQD